MSDVICDVTNDLLSCEEWDESRVFSNLSDFVPPDEEMTDIIPFAEVEDLDGKTCFLLQE